MTDETTPTSESIADDVDADAVNVEAVNEGEAVPGEQPGAGSPVGGTGIDHEGGEVPPAEQAAESAAATVPVDEHQRLMAEYVNYKRRVDRDRVAIRDRAVHEVLETLLPVLDEIHLAREHGDLAEGPFRSIADKLEAALGRYGMERFGAKGEPFDPERHEALMNAPWPADDEELPGDATSTTIVTVLQPGYAAGERVLRAARVAVAEPE